MRALWNNLSDPSLHLLAIASLLVYLAFSGSWTDDGAASSPLGYCKSCHAHFMLGKACDCRLPGKIAHALP